MCRSIAGYPRFSCLPSMIAVRVPLFLGKVQIIVLYRFLNVGLVPRSILLVLKTFLVDDVIGLFLDYYRMERRL